MHGMAELTRRRRRRGMMLHFAAMMASGSRVTDSVAPTITSASTANCAENAQLAHALTASESVQWSITGGVDQARFALDGATLTWAANGTKDYEAPDDTGANNTYVVQVQARDAAGNTATQSITITVTDVAEGGQAVTYFYLGF